MTLETFGRREHASTMKKFYEASCISLLAVITCFSIKSICQGQTNPPREPNQDPASKPELPQANSSVNAGKLRTPQKLPMGSHYLTKSGHATKQVVGIDLTPKVPVNTPTSREMQESLDWRTKYRGAIIKVDPNATGNLRDFELRFVDQFRLKDPQPESRRQHFSWIRPAVANTQNGWHGKITNAQIRADQSVVVTISIGPSLITQRDWPVNDKVKEQYLVKDGQIVLIGTDAGDSTGHNHFLAPYPFESP